MRILHLSQPIDGGAMAVVLQLAAAGLRAGFDVTVMSPPSDHVEQSCVKMGAQWRAISLTRSPGLGDLAAALRLRSTLKDFDVVHLHSSKAGAVGRLAAMLTPRNTRPKIVFTPHGWSWYVGGRAALVYRSFERLAAPAADHIVAVSSDERADGTRVLGPGTQVQTVPNGVDTETFRPAESAAVGRNLIVQVGRLGEQKGQDRTLYAMSKLHDLGLRARFVGSGPDLPRLQQLTSDLGLQARVEFVGDTDPRPHLRAAGVVVLPSRWEGMSLVLLEAMATAAAVVMTDCGGAIEVADHIVVISNASETQAISELSAAIRDLLSDPQSARELGQRARRHVVNHLSFDRTADAYHALYRAER